MRARTVWGWVWYVVYICASVALTAGGMGSEVAAIVGVGCVCGTIGYVVGRIEGRDP